MQSTIRHAIQEDAAQIAEIYNHYIRTSTVTFETEELSADQMQERIETIQQTYPYLVYEENNQVVGYAYANIFRTRIAYKHSSESSVYVHPDHFRKGIASQLYERLLEEMKASNLKSAIGGITLPNEGSVVLHEKFGFKKVAHFEKVGFKFEQWLDVGFWQLML